MIDHIEGSEWFVFISMLLQLLMSPSTKVEESFNLQATHDILYHGTNITAYDHNEFPGVVPRTFIGPLYLAALTFPFRLYQYFVNPFAKIWMQIAVRGALGSTVVLSFLRFARSIEWHLGKETAENLRIIVATQFHFMFYASRPLPNIFALAIVLYVISLWIENDLESAAKWAIIVTCLFRSELVLLFGPLFIPSLISGRIPLFTPFSKSAIGIALTTVIPLLVITIPIDSFFWGRWVWPEFDVIRFNVLDNRSHEYGTSPFLWYFYSALPRCLLGSLILLPLSFIYERRLIPLISPFIIFIGLYSFLPHKELRFIIYVVPILSVPSSVLLARFYINRHKSFLHRLLSFSFYILIISNIIATFVFTNASVRNYPGGDALQWLQQSQRFDRNKPRSVHIDVYCAQSGVSRFYEMYSAWEYNKTEDLTMNELERFDFLLIGSSNSLKEIVETNYSSYRHMIIIQSFNGFIYPKYPFNNLFIPYLNVRESAVVLKKKD